MWFYAERRVFSLPLTKLDNRVDGAGLSLGHNLLAFGLHHLRVAKAYLHLLSPPAEARHVRIESSRDTLDALSPRRGSP